MRRLPSVLSAALVLALSVPAAAATVSVNTDAGPNSLRQVLAAANDGDTIDFALAPGTTITLTTGELLLTKNVTIAGPSVEALTIDGSDAARIFHVAPGKTVTIANLTMTNGRSPDANADGGGCIYNENATLTLDHVAVRLCTANWTRRANRPSTTSNGGRRKATGTPFRRRRERRALPTVSHRWKRRSPTCSPR